MKFLPIKNLVYSSGVMFAFVRHETQQKELLKKNRLIMNEKSEGEVIEEEEAEGRADEGPTNSKTRSNQLPLERSQSRKLQFPLIKLL